MSGYDFVAGLFRPFSAAPRNPLRVLSIAAWLPGHGVCPERRGKGEPTMDTFFVRKQLFVGAILLGVLEVGVLLVRAFTH